MKKRYYARGSDKFNILNECADQRSFQGIVLFTISSDDDQVSSSSDI